METFLFALRAIAPILLIIGLGMAVRRLGNWDGAFFKRLNGLCFHLFLPINLFWNIYTVEDLREINWLLMGFLALGILAALGIGWVVTTLLIRERSQKGVMIQASFRANHAILGLPLAESLGGAAAMGFASVAKSMCVPIYNILAVWILSWYSGAEHPGMKTLLKRMAKNPLIGASLFGMLLVILRNALGLETPVLQSLPSIYKTLQNLSRVASPLMLFVLGACLDFKAVGGLLPKISLGVLLRLVLAPGVVIGASLLLWEPLQITSVHMPTILAVCASPVAVSSSVMTQEIGGDDQLASQIVVWSSAASMLTIFLLVFFLRSVGAL